MLIQPKIDILPAPQKSLWPQLKGVPKEFVLYRGTAVALRYGHRESIDFDFFTTANIDVRVAFTLPLSVALNTTNGLTPEFIHV